jgi:hypothetical protein
MRLASMHHSIHDCILELSVHESLAYDIQLGKLGVSESVVNMERVKPLHLCCEDVRIFVYKVGWLLFALVDIFCS